MMFDRKNVLKRLLLPGVICLMMLLLGSAALAETGSLTVKLGAYEALPSDVRVQLTLYRIGSMDPSAASGWRMNDDVADYGVLNAKTSSELGAVAEAVAKAVVPKYAGVTQTLNRSGATVFTGLEPGVYLGALKTGPSGLRVAPFIVTIPTVDETTRQVIYAYDVNTKAEYVPPTPTPTPVVTPVPTNTPEPTPTPTPVTEIDGRKIWEDDGNAHNTRPTAITVELYADGVLVDSAPAWSDTDTGIWSYSFTDLPELNEAGEAINYTVQERAVPGYESIIDGTTITNRLIPKETKEYTDIDGQKTWNDQGSDDRPSYVTVRLLQNGQAIEKRTVTAATDWKYAFEHLPVDDGYGNIYTYTIREDPVTGYFPRYNGYDILNSRLPEPPEEPDEPPKPKEPPFEEYSEEELEELLDFFDYGTPLWGVKPTGDELPAWPFVSGGIGVAAILALIVLGRKRRGEGKK